MKKKEDQGLVRDLVKKVKKGELSPEEAKEEVLKRGLYHKRYELKYTRELFLSLIAGIVLCFLPYIAELTRLESLRFLAELQSIIYPPTLVYISIVITLSINILGIYATYLRIEKGGTHSENEPIILVKEGPYAIMRHTIVGLALLLPTFTIVFSYVIPFTIFSFIGSFLYFLAFYYMTKGEDELNILKWGDEYKRYMEEVPRFNLILGTWRRIRKSDQSTMDF